MPADRGSHEGDIMVEVQQRQHMPDNKPADNHQQAPDALDALQTLDSDRAKIASDYNTKRTSTIVWIAVVYGLLTLTYWLIPQVWFNRFNLPWDSAWLVFALLAISLLLLTAVIMLNSQRQGIAPQWMGPKPVMQSHRYKIALAAHFFVNFIPPILALAVGFASDAWWSAVAVTIIGAAINGVMETWEFDEFIRALRQRTAPNPSASASSRSSEPGVHHGNR